MFELILRDIEATFIENFVENLPSILDVQKVRSIFFIISFSLYILKFINIYTNIFNIDAYELIIVTGSTSYNI